VQNNSQDLEASLQGATGFVGSIDNSQSGKREAGSMSASPAQIKWKLIQEEKEKKRKPPYQLDKILEEIVKLKKQKQDLPPLSSEHACEVDKLCLLQAFRGVVQNISSDIIVFSEHYDVPEDVLTAIVADWIVSKHMGVELMPIEFFGC
jgi:hypothetical protein